MMESHFLLLKTQNDSDSLASDVNNLCAGQFKVQRGGCWRKLNFERSRVLKAIENKPCIPSTNSWIQRFKALPNNTWPYIASFNNNNNNNYTIPNQLKICESANQDLCSGCWENEPRNHGGTTTLEHPPASSLDICRQESVGSNTEVPGENFMGESLEGATQPSRTCKKRRTGSADVDA